MVSASFNIEGYANRSSSAALPPCGHIPNHDLFDDGSIRFRPGLQAALPVFDQLGSEDRDGGALSPRDAGRSLPFPAGRCERESRRHACFERTLTMTEHKSFKRLVRARMAKTGEGHAAARAMLLRAEEPKGTTEVRLATSDEKFASERAGAGRRGSRYWMSGARPSAPTRPGDLGNCLGQKGVETAADEQEPDDGCADHCDAATAPCDPCFEVGHCGVSPLGCEQIAE